MMRDSLQILAVEPNSQVTTPYHELARFGQVYRYTNLEEAAQWLSSNSADIVCVSASFQMSKTLRFLQFLKSTFITTITPLVMIVDFSQQISLLAGTRWGSHMGILHSLSSVAEVEAALDRLMSPASSESLVIN